MMDDLSEGDFHKDEEPASPAPPPSQQHTDPASPTVAVTPEPVARGEQATPSEVEYQVNLLMSLYKTFYELVTSVEEVSSIEDEKWVSESHLHCLK